MNRQSTEGSYSSEIFCMILLRWMDVTVHLPKSTESRTPKARSPQVNYRIQMFMMGHCKFILGDECSMLVSEACVGARSKGEISVPSSSFSCEPKTALKNKVFLNVYLLKTFFFFTKKQKENTICILTFKDPFNFNFQKN